MSMRATALLLGLVGTGCTGANTTQSTSGSFGSTGFSNGGFTGTTGTASGFFGYGNASVTNDDDFGFTPKSAQVVDIADHLPLERVKVMINRDQATCNSEDDVHVALTFGTPGTALTAGSYLVDGGATIVWGAGASSGGRKVAALGGLINCNSVQPNVVAGSFLATLPLDDGGTSELTGIFTAATCQ